MKGNIFIGWSQDDSLAFKVKKILETKDYSAVVGGKTSSELSHGVGDTIIKQMKTCVGAIMLFTPRDVKFEEEGKEVTGKTLSMNMLFELGFLVGSLRLKRVFTVYIDGAEKYAPSDIAGGWNIQISTQGKTLEQVAQEIIDVFTREQVNTLEENKLELLADISILRSRIMNHIVNPVYYEWEMAQMVLVYGQAAYMFHDMVNAEELLKEISHNVEGGVLTLAIDAVLAYFQTCNSLVNDDEGVLHLPMRAYYKIQMTFENIAQDIKDIDTDEEFKKMLLMICYNQLTFANMMYYGYEKDTDTEETMAYRLDCLEKSILYSEEFRNVSPARNEYFSALFDSYSHRNKALLLKNHNMPNAQEEFELSRQCRYKILRFVTQKDLNKIVQEHVAMEYYLALSDNLLDVSEDVKRRRCIELDNYLDECSKAEFDKTYLVGNISRILKQARGEKE